MRTEEAARRYLVHCRARDLSPFTIANYQWCLDKLLLEFPDALPESENEICEMLIKYEYLAPASFSGLFRKLKTFFNWLEKSELGRNVMADIPSPRERCRYPRILSEEEIERLMDAAVCLRDYVLLAVLLDTGMRIGEMHSMRHSSIVEGGVKISGKTGDRTVPISGWLLELLAQLGEGDHIWVGEKGPLTRSGLQQIVKRTLLRAKIQPPKLGPHLLRHTFATRWIVNGGDPYSLQRILGHSKIEMTMIYVTMSHELLKYQHDKFSPMADCRRRKSR